MFLQTTHLYISQGFKLPCSQISVFLCLHYLHNRLSASLTLNFKRRIKKPAKKAVKKFEPIQHFFVCSSLFFVRYRPRGESGVAGGWIASNWFLLTNSQPGKVGAFLPILQFYLLLNRQVMDFLHVVNSSN